MQTALEGIKSLPGVTCALFYDPKIGIVSSKSDPNFTEDNLTQVCNFVDKFFSWGMDLFPDIDQIRLSYDDLIVRVIKPSGNSYLVIIHEGALDENQLRMRLAQTGESPKESAQKPINVESIDPILSGMETALNKVMGPMAAIVFGDTKETWISSADQTSKASVEKLVQMLCGEIGDQDKIKTFKELVSPLIENL